MLHSSKLEIQAKYPFLLHMQCAYIIRHSYHTFMSPIREVDMMHILYSGVASGLVDRVLTTPKI